MRRRCLQGSLQDKIRVQVQVQVKVNVNVNVKVNGCSLRPEEMPARSADPTT
jgi:hypothetical protein